ncbi:hypothetical protein CDAR_204781, partial [Caerostris darwini]
LDHAFEFKRKDKDLLQWLGQHDKPIRCGTDVLRVQCPMRAITLFQWRPLPPLSPKRLFIAFRGMSIRRRRGRRRGLNGPIDKGSQLPLIGQHIRYFLETCMGKCYGMGNAVIGNRLHQKIR